MLRPVELVSYGVDGGIATLRMDDGKVNALSPAMLAELAEAFDAAEKEAGVVVLTGREGIFSAGFSLPVLQGGGREAAGMLRAGFGLAERMLSFPLPVLIACTGHAVAMASFLLLSADYRLGADGPFRIQANEVAIGLTMPHAAVEICRHRLAPAHFTRVVALAEAYTPAGAVEAGFLDRAVAPADLATAAGETASRLAGLDRGAHVATKLRARGAALQALQEAIVADFGVPPA